MNYRYVKPEIGMCCVHGVEMWTVTQVGHKPGMIEMQNLSTGRKFDVTDKILGFYVCWGP